MEQGNVLNENAKMTAQGLAYHLTQWLLDRGYMNDADAPTAMRQMEELICAYVDECIKRMVKDEARRRDAANETFR